MPYLTPDINILSQSPVCRKIAVSGDLLYLVSGALSELEKDWNWESFGTASIEETTAYFKNALDIFSESDCMTEMFEYFQPTQLILQIGSVAGLNEFQIPTTNIPYPSTLLMLDCVVESDTVGEIRFRAREGVSTYSSMARKDIIVGFNRFQILAPVGAAGIFINVLISGGAVWDMDIRAAGKWSVV